MVLKIMMRKMFIWMTATMANIYKSAVEIYTTARNPLRNNSPRVNSSHSSTPYDHL